MTALKLWKGAVQPAQTGWTRDVIAENYLKRSNQFDTTWINVNGSETSGKADPDGGTDAWGVNESSGSGAESYISQNNFTLPGGGQWRFSAKIAPSGRDWVRLAALNFGGGDATAFFDVTNGVVGTTSGTDDTGITALDAGFYLCWIDLTIDPSDLTGAMRFNSCEGDNDAVNNPLLNAEGFILYQSQMEPIRGASHTSPGPYVETEGTSPLTQRHRTEGAVTPTGKEIYLYKGAVQPTAFPSTGKSFIGNLVRNLVGNLVRPLVR